MKFSRLAAVVVLLAYTGGDARAGAAEASLSEMVDNLQRLQVKVATGDKAAYAAEAAQLRAIGGAMSAAKPERWKDRAESIAAIVYVLSGGQPRDIAKALLSGGVPKREETLMRGALAYVVGREREAASLIGAVDPRTLDLRIAGQFAYVLGVIEIQRDAKKALALLDLARLLAPGGLVEEAALRREILLAGEQKDADRVAALARQYLIRFGRSIYAGNFMQGFALTVVRLNLIENLASFEKFQRFARSMNSENRLGFMLAIARGELDNGKFDVAASAALDALRETASDSAEEARGQFYQASARILSGKYDEGVAQLDKVASAKLGASDRALLGAVKELTAHLHEILRHLSDERERKSSGAPPASDSADPAAATIKLAEAAIERTFKLADTGTSP